MNFFFTYQLITVCKRNSLLYFYEWHYTLFVFKLLSDDAFCNSFYYSEGENNVIL